MNVLIVDDEPLARLRLKGLLQDQTVNGLSCNIQEAANAQQAWQLLQHSEVDLLMLDIHMPGMDGLQLASRLRTLGHPPSVVFVTAHPEHALEAFELQAEDYLTKPIRPERLRQCVEKLLRLHKATPDGNFLSIHERGKTHRIELADVLYFKAELKYITLRTAQESLLFEGSLQDIEQKYTQGFVRIHRNALVALSAIQTLERGVDEDGNESWLVRLRGVTETLQVSRRQLPHLRTSLEAG